jgi:hypothetical protein
MTSLVTTTYAARTRLVKSGRPNWSLAILVPTKSMTRLVSDAFGLPPAGMAAISHVAVIELEAAILAAEVIAFLNEPGEMIRHLVKASGEYATKDDIKEFATKHDVRNIVGEIIAAKLKPISDELASIRLDL